MIIYDQAVCEVKYGNIILCSCSLALDKHNLKLFITNECVFPVMKTPLERSTR